MIWCYLDEWSGDWLACDEATMHDTVSAGLTVGLWSWPWVLEGQWEGRVKS